MTTSPIRSIINNNLSRHGIVPTREVQTVIDSTTEDLEQALTSILGNLREYAGSKGLDAHQQDLLLEQVGLGFYALPDPEEEVPEDEPASTDARLDVLERNVSGLVEAVQGLTSLAERHLGRRI